MALIPYGIGYEGRDPSGALGQSHWLGGYGDWQSSLKAS